MNLRLTITTLVLFSAIAVVIFFTLNALNPNPVMASVYPRELTVNDILYYSDSTKDINSRLWEFVSWDGSSTKTSRPKGTYQFRKEGQYLIKLSINGELADTFSIKVKKMPPPYIKNIATTIYANTTGIVGENIHFKILGTDVEWCEWSFGETGKVDRKELETFYTFSTPKTYTVKLLTNLNPKVPILHKITIMPAYKPTENIVPAEKTGGGGGGSGATIKDYMQKIASGGDFQSNYDLIRGLICKNNVTIVANGRKVDYIYSYLQNLRIIKGTTIKNVITENDSINHCINKLTITSTSK